MPGTINITANGEKHSCAESSTLKNFLNDKGLNIDCVVVELNQEALTPSEAAGVTLSDGDQLEIVKIVAGG